MALHRYGGGVSREAVANLLAMPFQMLVRLTGAAKRATDRAMGKKDHKPTRDEEDAIVKKLDEKLAALRSAEATA